MAANVDILRQSWVGLSNNVLGLGNTLEVVRVALGVDISRSFDNEGKRVVVAFELELNFI